jgi:hypothetical protein
MELCSNVERVLALTKRKIYTNSQFNSIRVIFGGGGNTRFPYELGVLAAFEHPILRAASQPDSIGMPFPIDLDGISSSPTGLKRLYVAYGLAFPSADLAAFRYPSEIKYAIRTTIRRHVEDVSKDVC